MKTSRTYRFVAEPDGTPGIECLLCGNVSWSPHDVLHRYCGACHQFHKELKREIPDDPLPPDEEQAAHERAAQIGERLTPHIPEMKRMRDRAILEPHPRQKIIWLWRITQPLKEATNGLVPCKKGCAHCCHIPVLMHYHEAATISKLTGRKMRALDSYTAEANFHYTGTPCPFLEENRCSIYQSRPFACRVHYSLDRDESRCVLTGERQSVPYLNRKAFDMAYVNAIGTDNDIRVADIRDFFPAAA